MKQIGFIWLVVPVHGIASGCRLGVGGCAEFSVDELDVEAIAPKEWKQPWTFRLVALVHLREGKCFHCFFFFRSRILLCS